MARQLTTLPFDCLHEIFEYLEKDITTLHSCLLVNRLLCEISVRILWRDVGCNNLDIIYRPLLGISLSFFNTLFGCLPHKSKKVLYSNGIRVSTPTLKPPFFNYAAFCKVLSISGIISIVDGSLRKLLPFSSLNDLSYLVTNELINMFINQASLKVLSYYYGYCFPSLENKLSLPYFPGMRNLSELHCNSSLPSDFFHQLSQNCHNIQSISISLDNDVSNELKELISSQNNLKSLTLKVHHNIWTNIIPDLTKHSNTLTKLHFCNENENNNIPLSFIGLFKNLQEIIFSFSSDYHFSDSPYINVKDFEKLQYVNFPKLQTLKIPDLCPKPEYLVKFLEINGKNLNKVYISKGIILNPDLDAIYFNNDLNLSIAKFCPNLKRLIRIDEYCYEVNVLKTILINCQYLEFIKIHCEHKYLTGTILDDIANYLPNNLCELILCNSKPLDLLHPKTLELFFTNWKDKKHENLLKLIMISDSFPDDNDEYDEIINKDYNKEHVCYIIEDYKHEFINYMKGVDYKNDNNENDENYENKDINYENDEEDYDENEDDITDYENDDELFKYFVYDNYEDCCNFIYYENMKIINKYENLGISTKFSCYKENIKEEKELDY